MIAVVASGCVSRSGGYSFGNRWAGRSASGYSRTQFSQQSSSSSDQVGATDYELGVNGSTVETSTVESTYETGSIANLIPPTTSSTTTTVTETVHQTHRNATEISTGNVVVTKKITARGSSGTDLQTDLSLNPTRHVGEVKLNLYVPDNASFVRAEPPPTTVSGQKLSWEWFQLHPNENQNVSVWLRPSGQGNVLSCVSVQALPFGCVEAEIGEPRLGIDKSGPATGAIGQPLTYSIRVNNSGNSVTENVVVTEFVPEGMVHSTGARELRLEAGNLQPGETKTTSITLTPQRSGEFVNRVEARAGNAAMVSATASTRVVQSGVKLEKSGPPQQFLGKSATYQITVSNSGDTPLSGVVVTDNAPPTTTITDASGGQVSGNQAVWNVGNLGVGQSKTMAVALGASQAGTTVNTASVRTAEGVNAKAEAATLWRGFAAVLVEMVDDPDPLLVGDTVRYTLRVTNQGTAPDSNLRVNVKFPSNIQPVSVSGVTPGKVSGDTVALETLDTIAAKQVASWVIEAKATGKGDGRVVAEINTEILKGRPVAEVESTQVY
ncbi:MAG: DUF11 domain-containing protein [Verrucomicrobiae bacterium]|nr:DUF11 domain-containing protein [Verrucomicrobiae bacterium]